MTEKFKASVKVMRSYDYCHFECSLSSDENFSLDEINEMRKRAAILVDEAIRQYKIAKKKEAERDSKLWQNEIFLNKISVAEKTPESERTIEQAALLRSYHDDKFFKEYDEDFYSYGDPEKDFHFSCLDHFKRTVLQS